MKRSVFLTRDQVYIRNFHEFFVKLAKMIAEMKRYCLRIRASTESSKYTYLCRLEYIFYVEFFWSCGATCSHAMGFATRWVSISFLTALSLRPYIYGHFASSDLFNDICAGAERIPCEKLAPVWPLCDGKMGPGTVEQARPFDGLACPEEKLRGRPV